jgi:rubrerythrin
MSEREPDEGGDPVCWLHRVCQECGRLAEQQPVDGRCPSCGADLPDA